MASRNLLKRGWGGKKVANPTPANRTASAHIFLAKFWKFFECLFTMMPRNDSAAESIAVTNATSARNWVEEARTCATAGGVLNGELQKVLDQAMDLVVTGANEPPPPVQRAGIASPVGRTTPRQRFDQVRASLVVARRLICEQWDVLEASQTLLADGANSINHRTCSEDLLTTIQAAKLLETNEKCLRSWRDLGMGPAYIKLTNRTIRYKRGDLESFISSRRVVQEPGRGGSPTEQSKASYARPPSEIKAAADGVRTAATALPAVSGSSELGELEPVSDVELSAVPHSELASG